MLVYKISNDINGKVYIGITEQTLETRWKGHLLSAQQKTNRHLYNAMNKYGIEHFNIEVIEDNITSKQELLEKEIFYIWFEYYYKFVDLLLVNRSHYDDTYQNH